MLREPLRGCREAQHEAIGGALPARSSMPRGRRYRDGGGVVARDWAWPEFGVVSPARQAWTNRSGQMPFSEGALGVILWGWYLEVLFILSRHGHSK